MVRRSCLGQEREAVNSAHAPAAIFRGASIWLSLCFYGNRVTDASKLKRYSFVIFRVGRASGALPGSRWD